MLEKFEVVVRKPVAPYKDEIHPLSEFEGKFNFDKIIDALEFFNESLRKGGIYSIHENDMMEGYENLPDEYLIFAIKYKNEYIIKDCGNYCARCKYSHLCPDAD